MEKIAFGIDGILDGYGHSMQWPPISIGNLVQSSGLIQYELRV